MTTAAFHEWQEKEVIGDRNFFLIGKACLSAEYEPMPHMPIYQSLFAIDIRKNFKHSFRYEFPYPARFSYAAFLVRLGFQFSPAPLVNKTYVFH